MNMDTFSSMLRAEHCSFTATCQDLFSLLLSLFVQTADWTHRPQGSAPPPVLHQVHLQNFCINQQVLYYWFNKVFRSVRYRVNCFSLKQWGMRTDRLHMRTWLFTENWESLEVAVVILPDINKSELEMRGEHEHFPGFKSLKSSHRRTVGFLIGDSESVLISELCRRLPSAWWPLCADPSVNLTTAMNASPHSNTHIYSSKVDYWVEPFCVSVTVSLLNRKLHSFAFRFNAKHLFL